MYYSNSQIYKNDIRMKTKNQTILKKITNIFSLNSNINNKKEDIARK